MLRGDLELSLAPVSVLPVAAVCAEDNRWIAGVGVIVHLAMDTLAFGCALVAIRPRSGLAPIRLCPCRDNKRGRVKVTDTTS